TTSWFYFNILEDEKEMANLIYDKLEYAVSFWDSKAAEKQRKIRLKAQGYDIKDSDLIQSTHFDQELLNELKELDPNLDTSKIKSLHDSVNFAQEVPFEEDIESNKNGSKYSEEDEVNLMSWLERDNGSLLTETGRQLIIYKLDYGQPINLK